MYRVFRKKKENTRQPEVLCPRREPVLDFIFDADKDLVCCCCVSAESSVIPLKPDGPERE